MNGTTTANTRYATVLNSVTQMLSGLDANNVNKYLVTSSINFLISLKLTGSDDTSRDAIVNSLKSLTQDTTGNINNVLSLLNTLDPSKIDTNALSNSVNFFTNLQSDTDSLDNVLTDLNNIKNSSSNNSSISNALSEISKLTPDGLDSTNLSSAVSLFQNLDPDGSNSTLTAAAAILNRLNDLVSGNTNSISTLSSFLTASNSDAANNIIFSSDDMNTITDA